MSIVVPGPGTTVIPLGPESLPAITPFQDSVEFVLLDKHELHASPAEIHALCACIRAGDRYHRIGQAWLELTGNDGSRAAMADELDEAADDSESAAWQMARLRDCEMVREQPKVQP